MKAWLPRRKRRTETKQQRLTRRRESMHADTPKPLQHVREGPMRESKLIGRVTVRSSSRASSCEEPPVVAPSPPRVAPVAEEAGEEADGEVSGAPAAEGSSEEGSSVGALWRRTLPQLGKLPAPSAPAAAQGAGASGGNSTVRV